jgi:hypothetical protein
MLEASLPSEIQDRLPAHLEGEQLQKTKALTDLQSTCEELLLDSAGTTKVVAGTIVSSAIPIKNGQETIYLRVFKENSKRPTYGFKLSPTAEDAPDYAGYADIRLELGTDGSYELVMGGDGSEPVINDISSIRYLNRVLEDKVIKRKSDAELARKIRHEKTEKYAKTAAIIGAVGLAVLGVCKVVPGIMASRNPESINLTNIITPALGGEQVSPAYIDNWQNLGDGRKFNRLVFHTINQSNPECQSIPAAADSKIYTVTDLHGVDPTRDPANPSFTRSLENQFTVQLVGNSLSVCWNEPSGNGLNTFEHLSTQTPVVGVFIKK